MTTLSTLQFAQNLQSRLPAKLGTPALQSHEPLRFGLRTVSGSGDFPGSPGIFWGQKAGQRLDYRA